MTCAHSFAPREICASCEAPDSNPVTPAEYLGPASCSVCGDAWVPLAKVQCEFCYAPDEGDESEWPLPATPPTRTEIDEWKYDAGMAGEER